MKTDSDRQVFTMQDFVKGLMLAGLIKPDSIQEVRERTALVNYEKLKKRFGMKTKIKGLSDELLKAEASLQDANSLISGNFLANEACSLDRKILSDMAKQTEDTSAGRPRSPLIHLEAQPKGNEYHMDLGPVPEEEPDKKAPEDPEPDKKAPGGTAKPRRRRIDSFRN